MYRITSGRNTQEKGWMQVATACAPVEKLNLKRTRGRSNFRKRNNDTMRKPATRSVAVARVTHPLIQPAPRAEDAWRSRAAAGPAMRSEQLFWRNTTKRSDPSPQPRAVSSPRPLSVHFTSEEILFACSPGSGPRGPATKGVMESRGQRGSGWRSPMSFGPRRQAKNLCKSGILSILRGKG